MEKVLGPTIKVIGLVLTVVEIRFAVCGYQISDIRFCRFIKVTQAVMGADTDEVMTYYIFGAVSFVVGICILCKN